jgi:transposase-like protein
MLEPQRMAERALAAVTQEAYVPGISTCAVEDLVRAMGLAGVAKSEVARTCHDIDAGPHAACRMG